MFTVITPTSVYRVRAKNYHVLTTAIKELGIHVLSVTHDRDGDKYRTMGRVSPRGGVAARVSFLRELIVHPENDMGDY